jgi:hypothetical protein
MEKQVSQNAYRLKLPDPMRRLHPVFNMVKLTPTPNDPIEGRHPKPPPPPKLIEGEEEYLVEKIQDSKMFRRRLRFLIKWEGYSTEHNTWEYTTDVHAPKCLEEFYWKHPSALCQIRAAIFSTIPFQPVPTCFKSKQS